MKKLLGTLILLSTASFTLAAAAVPPILSFDEVHAGMKGVGRTVFHGTEVEEFDVEILGKLPDIGPDQDLILGRLSGGPLAETGVMSGMSCSPVYIDGKLIGAVSSGWGFSKDAIAGITPIEQMLAISRQDNLPRRLRTAAKPFEPTDLAMLRAPVPEFFERFFAGRFAALSRGTGMTGRSTVPLAVSGIGPSALERIAPALRSAGFVPVQTGMSGRLSGPTPALVPGSAMGLKLVRGAVEMTATGTVTWVDDRNVLAFGHPLFGLGNVDLPLTGASVQALLPSLEQSSKIAVPLDEVGAIRQDRASGVLGRLGVEPRMIPVRVRLTGADGRDHTYSFDIADDPLLSPLLLYTSLGGIVASTERPFGSATVSLERGSVIKMLSGQDVSLDNLFAGTTAFDYGTSIAAYVLHLLMNNTWRQPEIAGVNLIVRYEETPRTGRITRASLSHYRARPGDSVTATVVVKPFRGPDKVLTAEIRIPEDTPPGPLTIYVAGAGGIGRGDDAGEPVLPQSLDQLVRLINQLRRNDRVYVLATREDAGALLAGARLPGLPPSVSRVLSRPRSVGNVSVMRRRAVVEQAIETDFAVTGASRLTLEVYAP